MEPCILSIAIATPPFHCFDYLVPEPVSPDLIQPGMRVQVPFGHTQRLGMVVAIKSRSDVPQERLKPVHHLIDQQPVLPADILALLWWASTYYHHPIGDVIATALPSLLRQDRTPSVRDIIHWRITELGRQTIDALPNNAFRQKQILTFLANQTEGVTSRLLNDIGFPWRAPIKACERKSYVQKEYTSPLAAAAEQTTPTYALNTHQQAAIDTIRAALHQFQTFLLDGVTGSGKTEVYLQLIESVLAQGRQVLVMIPEIGLTPQLLTRFQQRFTAPIATMHSAMTDQERLNTWMLVQSGEAHIVIGTRSAVFCPFAQLGLIVIDEEHDSSFKQQSGFRYHARDLAVYRAKQVGVPIVLGSATPSLETVFNVQRKRYASVMLPSRAGAGGAPRIQLVDVKRQPLKNGLALKVISTMEQTLARQEQVLVFLNRRGYAPIILCRQCGWSADCHHCDAKMTYHQKDERLRCHHCGYEAKIPTTCPSCATEALQKIGMGTQRLEKYLQQQFPAHTIARIDRDSTRSKGAFEAHLQAIRSGVSQILVGTQMLAKGHHFPNMTLVCILDVDSSLVSGDFRATERLAQQLIQVSGRAGREEKPGTVMIQTHHPEHPLLQTLFRKGYAYFSQMALQERRQAVLPPFCAQALLRAEANKRDRPMQFLTAAKADLLNLAAPIRCLGPIPSIMERKAGVFRAQLLLESDHRGHLQHVLSHWAPTIARLPCANKVRWMLDVDPLDVI